MAVLNRGSLCLYNSDTAQNTVSINQNLYYLMLAGKASFDHFDECGQILLVLRVEGQGSGQHGV